MIFSKSPFFVNYSVGVLWFQLSFAEKLVKLNWLRFLHHVMLFWRVFFREKLVTFNWLWFFHHFRVYWRVFSAKNWWHWIGYNSYIMSLYFDEFFREQLVTLNCLWFLHEIILFWRIFPRTTRDIELVTILISLYGILTRFSRFFFMFYLNIKKNLLFLWLVNRLISATYLA